MQTKTTKCFFSIGLSVFSKDTITGCNGDVKAALIALIGLMTWFAIRKGSLISVASNNTCPVQFLNFFYKTHASSPKV